MVVKNSKKNKKINEKLSPSIKGEEALIRPVRKKD